jgi:hypothetical protein
MTICKFLWTSPHRRCGFDRRPAAKLIGTDATASLTRVGWIFTLAITAYTLVRLPKLRPLRVSVLVEENLYRVCTRLAAGGKWIRNFGSATLAPRLPLGRFYKTGPRQSPKGAIDLAPINRF